MLVINTKQESHESRYNREETTYNNLPETRLVIVKDGFVTFFRHFKYLGSWISFSLREDHDIMKRIAAANASMGAMTPRTRNICSSRPPPAIYFKAQL